MQTGLFAKKVGMTQIFDESGTIFPVTILKAGVCKISQIKTTSTDGYNAIQVAYNEEKVENINKSKRGHLNKSGGQGFRSFGEFHVTNPEVIVIGGGVALAGDILFNGIKEKIKEYSLPVCVKELKILPAQLGNEAGVVGAAALVLN